MASASLRKSAGLRSSWGLWAKSTGLITHGFFSVYKCSGNGTILGKKQDQHHFVQPFFLLVSERLEVAWPSRHHVCLLVCPSPHNGLESRRGHDFIKVSKTLNNYICKQDPHLTPQNSPNAPEALHQRLTSCIFSIHDLGKEEGG